MTKDEPIVTFRTYYDPILAQIERAKLEDNDIPCFIADENIAGMNMLFNNAFGGIKLKVFERDIEQCEAILGADIAIATDEIPETKEETTVAVACPHCGSTNVRYGDAIEKKHGWLSIVIAFLFSAFPFYSRKA